MNWEDTKSAFTWDGSWRDLYILNTNLNDWQCLLDCIRSSGYSFRFISEKEEPLPKEVTSLFNLSENDIRPLFQIDVGGPILNCHFFIEDEIEFDLDPREVQTEREAAALFEFMQLIGRTIGKPVRLTPENMNQIILFEYFPETDLFKKNATIGTM